MDSVRKPIATKMGCLASGAIFQYRYENLPPNDGLQKSVKIDALYSRGIRDSTVALNGMPGKNISEIPVWFYGVYKDF